MSTRTELRQALEANRRHGHDGFKELRSRSFTDLGMHFIDIDGSPVLVTVEINVPRILAVLGKRLVKAKSATARLGNGSIRLTVATAEGRELCACAEKVT